MVPVAYQRTGTVRGPRTITCADVAVGEVWICSGQSNMEWPLGRAHDAKAAVPAATHPRIRLFVVARAARDVPQATCSGHWTPCTPEVAKGFSAVAFYFGRRLHEDLGVPIVSGDNDRQRDQKRRAPMKDYSLQ